MSKHRNDIAQIKKYISGELDARAMHRLERQALDDPFLADALEGYQNAGRDQQANLADLSAHLQNRTEGKVRLLIPWRQLSVAASVLVVIGVGIWLMTRNNNSPELKRVADNVKPVEKKQAPVVSSPSLTVSRRASDTVPGLAKVNKHKAYTKVEAMSSNDAASPPVVSELETNNIANANGNQQYWAQPKVDTSLFVAKAKAPASANGLFQTDKLANNSNNLLKPQVQDKSNAFGNSNQAVVPDQNATFKSSSQYADVSKKVPNNQPTLLQSKVDGVDVKPANKSLAGRVTDLAGTPLAGAVVRMNGNSFGVVTDENGRFIIHDVPEKKSLTVGYLGFNTQQVNGIGNDSINIALSPTKNALSDVTIQQGSMASKRSADAHPSAGWKALDNYLNKNAVSPDGQTGKVNLSFTVDAQGNLSNFTILKGLSTATDQKAIDLLTKGLGWVGAADGQSHEVKLTVEFK